MKQARCSLTDKKNKATEIWYEAPFLAGFIYFFDRMMPPHERRLSSAELSFQKLHLISTFSLWSILGSVEDLWKSDSAVSRKSITSGGHDGKKKCGCIFLVSTRMYCIHKKNADEIWFLRWTRAGGSRCAARWGVQGTMTVLISAD